MSSQSIYDNFPWEWIVSALQGELDAEEKERFVEWLATSPRHQEVYKQLQEIWVEAMADYDLYRAADENQAWQSLETRLSTAAPLSAAPLSVAAPASALAATPASATAFAPAEAAAAFAPAAATPNRGQELTAVLPTGSTTSSRKGKGQWIAIAAGILLISGAALWYSASTRGLRYETATEQRKVTLPDGSTLVLQPHTRLQLASGYNRRGRTISLLEGEASFDVLHQPDQPFTVEMDAATVRDIGTSFTITRTADSIKVIVSTGKVAFTKKETGDIRELSAGSTLCLYTGTQRHGELRIATSGDANNLHFDNATLAEVITALQDQFGTKIRLQDTTFARKRLTVHLEGENLEDAIKTICGSLDLGSTSDKEGYLLTGRDSTNKN